MSLTRTEHNLIDLAGVLYTRIAADVVADGPCREDDLRELRFHIHNIQRMLLAQATARAYPDRYRLLGLDLTSS